MNIEETKKAIEVMQAFVDGKTIEHRDSEGLGRWYVCTWDGMPLWNWYDTEYRVKPAEPKEIWVNEYPAYPFVGHETKEDATGCALKAFTRKAVHYREVIEE